MNCVRGEKKSESLSPLLILNNMASTRTQELSYSRSEEARKIRLSFVSELFCFFSFAICLFPPAALFSLAPFDFGFIFM